MDCKKAKDLLSSYIDKKLSEKDKELLELHLRDCQTCQEFLQDLKETVKLVNSLNGIEPPADLFSDIQKEIQKIPEPKKFSQKPFWIRIPIEVFATTVVFLIVFFITQSLIKTRTPVGPDVSLQKDTRVSSRWALPEEVPGAKLKSESKTKEEPVSEEAKEIYDVIEKVRKAYKDMGVSPITREREQKAVAQTDKDKKKEELSYSITETEPPKAWETDTGAYKKGVAVETQPQTSNKTVEIMRKYNITIEVNNLSEGVNELTTQVYNYKGTFIPPTGVEISSNVQGAEHMIFKIPTGSYYQFIWNLERVGTIKEFTPTDNYKAAKDDFVTIYLRIDIAPMKK